MSWRVRSPKTLAHRWPLNGHYADLVRGQDGTPVNAPTWTTNQFGHQCIELDGDDAHVNLGDVVELNAVSAFTICFWMNQDVIDQTGFIFAKYADISNQVSIYTFANGEMYFEFSDVNRGRFDYSTIISTRNWHHIAMVFDGGQTGNVNRLIVYVDGLPITLTFEGTIPAATVDLSGIDAIIGYLANSFDGKLSDFRIYSTALTRDEVNQIIRGPKGIA